jgi:ActR/RegA family two-component response regulator
MDSPNLVGYVVLIVEPDIGLFVSTLQAALEKSGSETLAVQSAVEAFERLKAFRFSVCVLNYDASAAIDALIGSLSDIPVLLYGNESAAASAARTVPHLTFAHATVCSIMRALGRMLDPAND